MQGAFQTFARQASSPRDTDASCFQVPVYPTLSVEHDAEARVLRCNMRTAEATHYSNSLLRDLASVQNFISATLDNTETRDAIRYVVIGSEIDQLFNLGGDLALFERCIRMQDREALTSYAHRCTNIVFNTHDGYGGRAATIALVQGHALGGGFEAALANHVLIAERGARFGLPETMFNLFPGMGAYSLLSRKLNPASAERMILSGAIYTAEELHEMGIVDVVCDVGAGSEAVQAYIERHDKQFLARRAVMAVRDRVNPLTRRELIDVTNLWVDTALALTQRDLKRMERLVRSQARRHGERAGVQSAA